MWEGHSGKLEYPAVDFCLFPILSLLGSGMEKIRVDLASRLEYVPI